MTSSASVEGKLCSDSRQHKLPLRSLPQRSRVHRNRMNSELKQASHSTIAHKMETSAKSVTKIASSKSSSRYHRRNLREKRRPTGINLFSNESTGGTSTGEEDEEQMSLITAKTISHLNESQKELRSDETKDLKLINEELREQLRLKDEYIHHLEAKVKSLELTLCRTSISSHRNK